VRRPAALALLVAVAVVATACGFKHEPTGALAPTFPVTVHDGLGRSVTLANQPTTILALDAAGLKILRSIGAPATRVAPGASVASMHARHPDLVVMGAETAASTADSMAQRLGAPTFVLAGVQLASIERGVAQLGLATGHALTGRNLAIGLRARRGRLARSIANAKPQTVFVDTGFGYSIPSDGLLPTLVGVAGGTLVGAEQAQPVSAKALIALDPDVYAVERSGHVTLRVLRKRKGTAHLPAVLDGRVLTIDDRLLEPDQDAYRLAEQIARFLHPEASP
jgi:ABC-type Fe3+-hydroxamate transport system substrate-binding protein